MSTMALDGFFADESPNMGLLLTCSRCEHYLFLCNAERLIIALEWTKLLIMSFVVVFSLGAIAYIYIKRGPIYR